MAARKGGDTFPIEFPFFSWKAGEETFFTAIIRDITERKRAEEALQQSEAAVRKKLAALLEPEGDIGVLSLADIIDCPALQKIMEDFHRFSNITSAVVDSSGNLLIAVGFQDICMQFHRVHPETSVFCRESDVELAAGQQAGAFKAYRCKNHLWDMATPIVVGGRHMGNFYIGQFFYRNEVPDYEHFRSLARRYGFNENEYLAALDRVPRFDRETVEAAMAFYAKLSAMISSLSYSTVALGRALAQKETAFAGMEKSEQRLNLALDAARMGTFDSDLQSMHLNWSPSHEALWGYRPGEFDGTYEAFARRVHPDDLPDVEAEVNRCIAERALLNKEFRVVWPDGRVHWMMCTGRIIFDAAGAAVNLLGVTMEITERKQMEEALEKQNAELTRFAYSMSHDLKSPLVTIKTFLGYLEKDMQKQDAGCIEKDFTYIHGAADKMGRLLDELLELTRIGRIMNPEVEAPLQDIVQEALVLVAGRIAERGVKIEVTQQPLLLRGDRLRLVEVFQNLIDNAVKFMGDQKEPKIEIGLKIKNGGNLLFVRDNGMGLDPRYQDKLFGLFEKLNPKMEGAGMGLALVKRIVEVHGGRILVESEGLGKGACFWFSLPGRSSES